MSDEKPLFFSAVVAGFGGLHLSTRLAIRVESRVGNSCTFRHLRERQKSSQPSPQQHGEGPKPRPPPNMGANSDKIYQVLPTCTQGTPGCLLQVSSINPVTKTSRATAQPKTRPTAAATASPYMRPDWAAVILQILTFRRTALACSHQRHRPQTVSSLLLFFAAPSRACLSTSISDLQISSCAPTATPRVNYLRLGALCLPSLRNKALSLVQIHHPS